MKKTMAILLAAIVGLCVLSARAEYVTVIGTVSSATESIKVIPEKSGQQIVVRTFEGYGDNGAPLLFGIVSTATN